MTRHPIGSARVKGGLLAIWLVLSGAVSNTGVQPAPVISTVACGGPDGIPARSAAIVFSDIALDGAGNIYVASSPDHRIFKIDPSGRLTSPPAPVSRSR